MILEIIKFYEGIVNLEMISNVKKFWKSFEKLLNFRDDFV
jgi:hypothetical protein